MTVAAVLPSNSTAFERALAAGLTDELPVPLAQIMDPATTPAVWLPWLAAHEGVRLWFDDWPEARKRQIIAEWPELAALIGARAAAERFLAYVDADVIHKVSHPSRYPVGRLAVRVHPVNHKPFIARFLVKTALTVGRNTVCVARTAVGRAAPRPINREPLRRAKRALAVSKAPETSYSVTFAHRLPIRLDDGIDLDGGVRLGDFKDRIRL